MGEEPPDAFHVELEIEAGRSSADGNMEEKGQGAGSRRVVFDVEITALMTGIPGVNWRWVVLVKDGVEGEEVYQG